MGNMFEVFMSVSMICLTCLIIVATYQIIKESFKK